MSVLWKPVVYDNYEFYDRYIVSDAGEIKDLTGKAVVAHVSNSGYFVVNVVAKNLITGKRKSYQFQLHRIVARSFIGPISGLSVHHIDGNKRNNRVDNLEVISQALHAHNHGVGENNNWHKISEKEVHMVCKLLEDGKLTHAEIVKKINNPDFTISSLEKISSRKNWTHVSDQYNFKVHKRRTMNQFTKHRILIAILSYHGFKNKEILKILGYEKVDNKTADAFVHCVKRYRNAYIRGEYGLFSKREVNELLSSIQESAAKLEHKQECSTTIERIPKTVTFGK